MKMRSLCGSSGEPSPTNVSYASDGYLSSVEAWDAPESFDPPTNIGFFASPYNPDDIGIFPLPRNEADSNIEIAKQTSLWQKGSNIAASMLQFFPGTTSYMATIGQAPATFVIPDAKKSAPPLKTGLLGAILPNPDGINWVKKAKVVEEEPKEPGFWTKYFDSYAQAGATSTAAGGVDFIKTKGVETAKGALIDTFGPPAITPETRSGIDAILQTAGGKDAFNMNWLLLGGAALVLILLIAR